MIPPILVCLITLSVQSQSTAAGISGLGLTAAVLLPLMGSTGRCMIQPIRIRLLTGLYHSQSMAVETNGLGHIGVL